MYTNKFSYSHIVNTSLAIERYMEFIGSPLKLGRPRKPRRIIIATLSEAEIARLIGATKNIRERTILALLAYSGIRAKEFASCWFATLILPVKVSISVMVKELKIGQSVLHRNVQHWLWNTCRRIPVPANRIYSPRFNKTINTIQATCGNWCELWRQETALTDEFIHIFFVTPWQPTCSTGELG